MRRLPSVPPVLPGFSYIRVLGSGGFADVFLFEQNMPRRQVAVKVLLSERVDDRVRQMFQAEANVMAQLSDHPSVLTIYQAGVSSDGRPYLVMERCSSALAERYRVEHLPVALVVKTAIRIGSAIETAHQAGVLHRDIKPSNVLLTAYGNPVLSDFGVAASLIGSSSSDWLALSIPWSAPEMLEDRSSGSIAAEVWSFAATVYSLLAGRSPFESPAAENSATALTRRIRGGTLPPIGRPDVPARLERALAKGMSRRPEDRHESILELVREVQNVETELGLPATPAEVVRESWVHASSGSSDERTLLRSTATPARAGRWRLSRKSPTPGVAPGVPERRNLRRGQRSL